MEPTNSPSEQLPAQKEVEALVSTYCETAVQFQQAIVTADIGGALTIYQASDSSFMRLLYTQVNAMLFVLRPVAEGGQTLRDLLPTIPRSLSQGQLCRIVWRDETIALSIHEHPASNEARVTQDIAYMQKLAAMIEWAKGRHLFSGDLIPGEEIKAMILTDALDMAQLFAATGLTPTNEHE